MNTSSGNSQFGGTLLGLIIGLVIGLGVALGVALYVTKAPVPFMDRGVQRPNTSDAVEAERAKDWNPNQGLSRTPEIPAPADASGASSAPPGTSAPAAPSTDPIGQLIQQSSPGSATTVTPVDVTNTPDPFIYFVQAGAYRSMEEANAQRARMAMAGFESQVSEREQGGKPVYRVRMGPFNARAEAESIEQKLRTQGFDTALVRVQR